MGTSSDPSSDDPKPKIVMGYPSIDRYHPAQEMYPPTQGPQGYPMMPVPPQGASPYPVPYHPQVYAAPQPTFHMNQDAYASTSFAHNQAMYTAPQFSHKQPMYLGNAPPNPYPSMNDNDYQQQYYKPVVVHDTSETTSFGRLMLILMFVLVTSMCMMSIVMWLLFGTYIPEFEVTYLKVSNFTSTNTTITGIWDAKVTVKNLNEQLPIQFDHVRSSIFYQEVMMGMSSLSSFEVQQKQQTELNFSMTAEPQLSADRMQTWLLPTLDKDRSNGLINFSLRLSMNANFTSPHVVYRQEIFRVLCDNLQITVSPSGEGTLSPGMETPCMIRLRDSLE